MAAEIIGRFKNQISTPALKAAADLEKLTGAAAAAEGALKGLQGAGGSALPARGSGGRSAAPANSNGGGGRAAPAPPDPSAYRRVPPSKRPGGGLEDLAARVAADQKAKAAEEKSAEKTAAKESATKKKADKAFADASARQRAWLQGENERIAKRDEKIEADKQKAAKKTDDAKKKAGTAKPGGSAAGSGAGSAAASGAADKLLAAAKIAAVGLGAASIGQLALGYRGMERLAGITARAQLRFRQLFSGVQPKPLLDTLERVSFLFSKQTVAGRALGGIFERGFNGFFGAVKSAEPFILDFVKGIILGALRLENAWLRARIALFPLTSAVGRFLNVVGVGAIAGQLALGLLVGKFVLAAAGAVGLSTATLATVAPFLALAAAAGLAYSAIKSAFDEQDRAASKKVEDEAGRGNLLGQARAEKRRTGKVSASTQEALRKQEAALSAETAKPVEKAGVTATLLGTAAGTDKIALQQREAMIDDLAATRALMASGGAEAGAAMGAGIVRGMKGAEPLVTAAGAGLAGAADKGVTTKAEIRSPSGLMKRRARQMGEGVVVGFRASEAPVQAAASKSLVPDIKGGASGARGGSGGGGKRELHMHFPNYLGGRDELMAWIRQGLAAEMTETVMSMGLDTGATT